MIRELTKDEAMATLTSNRPDDLKEEIRYLKEEINDINRSIKALKRTIDKNNENNKMRLENIKSVSCQLASCRMSLEEEDLKRMQALTTVLSEDLKDAQIIERQNSEIRARISEEEELLSKKKELLIDNQQRLVEAEQELCKYLIIQVKQEIAAFNNGPNSALITFLTDDQYKKPNSDPEDRCQLPEWMISYRKLVIALLDPLVKYLVVDARTMHSYNDSPYCNGLQGAVNAIEAILSTISEIVSLAMGDNGIILSTLQIDTKYNHKTFFDGLSELVENSIKQINSQHLYNIEVSEFLNFRSSEWNTVRRYDEYGDVECSYSYDIRITKAFRCALIVLKEFAKIKFVSESRKDILVFTTAIKAASTPIDSNSKIAQFFRCCASSHSSSTGFVWKSNLCSFLGKGPPKDQESIQKEDN